MSDYTREQMNAEFNRFIDSKTVAALPDCRTCKNVMNQSFIRYLCESSQPCTNADQYQLLPPVRLWRTT